MVYYDPVWKSLLFDHDRRHGLDAAQKVLSDYQGYLQADGARVYDSYAKVPGITMVGCMAHARRKFFDAKADCKTLAEHTLTLIVAVYAGGKHI